jgi:hypothetical protein
VITACALLLCLAGGICIYLASKQQQWRAQALPRNALWAGWLLAILGTAAWIVADGAGVGVTASASTLMLAWVSMPYLSWWRSARKASA